MQLPLPWRLNHESLQRGLTLALSMGFVVVTWWQRWKYRIFMDFKVQELYCYGWCLPHSLVKKLCWGIISTIEMYVGSFLASILGPPVFWSAKYFSGYKVPGGGTGCTLFSGIFDLDSLPVSRFWSFPARWIDLIQSNSWATWMRKIENGEASQASTKYDTLGGDRSPPESWHSRSQMLLLSPGQQCPKLRQVMVSQKLGFRWESIASSLGWGWYGFSVMVLVCSVLGFSIFRVSSSTYIFSRQIVLARCMSRGVASTMWCQFLRQNMLSWFCQGPCGVCDVWVGGSSSFRLVLTTEGK